MNVLRNKNIIFLLIFIHNYCLYNEQQFKTHLVVLSIHLQTLIIFTCKKMHKFEKKVLNLQFIKIVQECFTHFKSTNNALYLHDNSFSISCYFCEIIRNFCKMSDGQRAKIEYEKYKARMDHIRFLGIKMHQEEVVLSKLIQMIE